VARQPQRERDEDDAQDDQRSHDDVEGANERTRGEQPIRRHELDRPEVVGQRDPEGRREPPGQDTRLFGRREVGDLNPRRDEPDRLQLGQGRLDDREHLDDDVPVHDAHGLGFGPKQLHDPGVAERERPDQRRLDAGVRERDLEALVDGVADGEGEGPGERLGRVR